MGRRDEHRTALAELAPGDWAGYLRQRSGLPGPRANLELAQAVGDAAGPEQVDALLATDDEYLVLCGAVALGRQLAEGRDDAERRLWALAADDRWRVREGVAMGLQRLGDSDLERLLDLADRWACDADPLVLRAAVAGVCEPRLLAAPGAAGRALELCERVTQALAALPPGERTGDGARTLRQALGYCWSVAVAADPASGLPRFRRLARSDDPDLAWIARENAKKRRLSKLL